MKAIYTFIKEAEGERYVHRVDLVHGSEDSFVV